MRHRDHETAAGALKDWLELRQKVKQEGGENYEKPVLVQFLDRNTYEVMDRDIVEDEFYVLRRYKIVRELDPKGTDLEEAIKATTGGGKPGGRPGSKPGSRSGRSRGSTRGRRQGGKPKAEGKQDGKPGDKPDGKGRSRRRRRPPRKPKRGNAGE
jgi:hypothetical protein